MAFATTPTPRPDEKVVAIIEIRAPEVPTDSKDYLDFDAKFTRFKQEIDRLVTANFSGALKVKVVMKKDQQANLFFRT